MRNTAVILTMILFSIVAAAQPSNPSVKVAKKPSAAKNAVNEKADFEKALTLTDAAEKINALVKFVEDYPKSKEKIRASELIVSQRAALADEKFRAGEKAAAVELFKAAVRDAPPPISDKLFTEIVLQIPNSLFVRGETAAALATAKMIEGKTEGNAKQMLAVAAFYLATENASEARRLADQALILEPNLPAAYQTLGLAYRLDFQLEESANAYAKALELDANSVISKRSLAEMKRANGKVAEAVVLYREILAAGATDAAAQTGLILALFDAGDKSEAESEMTKSLDANPNNLPLLVGAAYWYAAHNDGAKAVKLAEKAVAVEPRYTWARIALARGLMQQKRLVEAEKALLAARKYGDFPTLDYELAAARYQSGFYREAAETLAKKFSVEDGALKTNLGGRVNRTAKSFVELLAAERRASIFQTLAADNIEVADKLKFLLDFWQKIASATDETSSRAADELVSGDDKMKIYRQLFAADQLLQQRKALPKVLELTKAAIGGVDAGLEMPNASSAVLADELYQSRRLAMTRNELIIVPEVPRATLSNIVRGRIEDITGWALFRENKSAEAVVRLKRAVSVLPEKSSWWRSSMWRLGTAQDAAENHRDALDAYIKSYVSGEGDAVKYGIIETAYQKVNGSTDGLEVKIGAKPASIAATFPVPTDVKSTEQTTTAAPTPPEIKTESAPDTPNAENPNQTKTALSPEIIITENTDETKSESKQPEKIADSSSETAAKSLFEPIIISVPKPELLKKTTPEVLNTETPVKPETAPTPEVKASDVEIPEVANDPTKAASAAPKVETESPKVEAEPSESESETIKRASEPTKTEIEPAKIEAEPTKIEAAITESDEENKPSNEVVQIRPRVIIEDKFAPISSCQINVSQERISIVNDGGNSSLLVGIEGAVDAKEIKATSSNPADVVIVPEPEVTVKSGRAFFIVKSISQATGVFTVTFEAACGKKEVLVKVR